MRRVLPVLVGTDYWAEVGFDDTSSLIVEVFKPGNTSDPYVSAEGELVGVSYLDEPVSFDLINSRVKEIIDKDVTFVGTYTGDSTDE